MAKKPKQPSPVFKTAVKDPWQGTVNLAVSWEPVARVYHDGVVSVNTARTFHADDLEEFARVCKSLADELKKRKTAAMRMRREVLKDG